MRPESLGTGPALVRLPIPGQAQRRNRSACPRLCGQLVLNPGSRRERKWWWPCLGTRPSHSGSHLLFVTSLSGSKETEGPHNLPRSPAGDGKQDPGWGRVALTGSILGPRCWEDANKAARGDVVRLSCADGEERGLGASQAALTTHRLIRGPRRQGAPCPIHPSFDQVLPSVPSFCFVLSPHPPPFLFHLLNEFFPLSQAFIPVGSVPPHTPCPQLLPPLTLILFFCLLLFPCLGGSGADPLVVGSSTGDITGLSCRWRGGKGFP